MVHAHCMLDNCGYRHTIRICDTYLFATTTMVERTRLIVTLYVQCLSCIVYLHEVRNFIRKLLPPSSGWLKVGHVDVQGTGRKRSVSYVASLFGTVAKCSCSDRTSGYRVMCCGCGEQSGEWWCGQKAWGYANRWLCERHDTGSVRLTSEVDIWTGLRLAELA